MSGVNESWIRIFITKNRTELMAKKIRILIVAIRGGAVDGGSRNVN